MTGQEGVPLILKDSSGGPLQSLSFCIYKISSLKGPNKVANDCLSYNTIIIMVY